MGTIKNGLNVCLYGHYHLPSPSALTFPVPLNDTARAKNNNKRSRLFVRSYFLLTVSVPIGVNSFLAVQYNILARQETCLPSADRSRRSRNQHPPGISTTSPIVPVDEEAAIKSWLSNDRKVILWLTLDIRPGALTQSGE